MVNLNRVRVTWAGLAGGPGVSTHFFDTSATPPLAQIRAAYAGLSNLIPNQVTIQVQNAGDQIDAATGKIVGDWAGTAVAAVTSASSGSFSPACGAVVDWRSSVIVNNRRLRGRTFIVPLLSVAFSTAGQLTPAALTTLQTFATGLMPGTGPAMQLWARPVAATKGNPTPKAPRPGSSSIVVSNSIPNMTAILRSRRDA